jgi:phosphate transport system permease protein
MKEPSISRRIICDKSFKIVIILLTLCSILPMLFILFFIASKGFSVINWRFLTELPKPVGEIGGGISNAIIGTLILIGIGSAFSIPVGILAGTFLSENRKGRLASITRLCVETLQGVPSIVIGIIAYIWLVVSMGSFSAFSGGLALGMMMLPVIITATEETLKLIPESLREASLALGVSYPRTILKVIVPAGVGCG